MPVTLRKCIDCFLKTKVFEVCKCYVFNPCFKFYAKQLSAIGLNLGVIMETM